MVELDGGAVIIRRRKTLALLTYLAVTGRRQSREALAALLWPETDPSRAHAYVRTSLWTLREAGLGGWIGTHQDLVQFVDQPDTYVDVLAFRRCLAAPGRKGWQVPPEQAPPLKRAVEIYRDRFLSGFGVPDSFAFDEWQMREEEALRTELAETLDKLVRFSEGSGQIEAAIDYGRRWLALDPLDEPVRQRLMTLLARSGQRRAALKLFEDYARLCRKELGVPPTPEIAQLRDQIASGTVGEVHPGPPVDAAPRKLPAPSTPFVGRESELAQMQRLLDEPDPRLITITGPGGSGKTRLAAKAAEIQVDAFLDGVVFVPLAPVTSAEFLLPAITDALGVPAPSKDVETHPGSTPHRRLLDFLRARRMLIILDNLEHLLAGVDLVRDILVAAPHVKVIATSRERLNLSGEWVLTLEGLPVPPADTGPSKCATYSALQLFLQSARRARIGFDPPPDELLEAARACRLLEGSPLGIELAAAWVKTLSCERIASEIADSLDFLSTRERNVPERHRSLRAAFEHSWALLSAEERRTYRRLAVFRGGFGREAAAEVADASLATLSILIDKSLLRRSASGRYELHEVLRQFADEHLRASQREEARIRRRRSIYFLDQVTRREAALKGRRSREALDELSEEVENIRGAWLWAARNNLIRPMRQAVAGLFLFHDIQSRFLEGTEMCAEALSALEGRHGKDVDALRGMLLISQGWFARRTSVEESRRLARRGHACLEPFGRTVDLAFCTVLGVILGAWPEKQSADRLADCLAIYESHGDRWGMALTYEVMGFGMLPHDLAAAQRHARRSLMLRRQIGDQWGVGLALSLLGTIAESMGMGHVARQRFQESLQLRRKMGEGPDGLSIALSAIARVARLGGNFEEARRLYLGTLDVSRRTGNRYNEARLLTRLGKIEMDQGDHVGAHRHLTQAQTLHEALGDEEMASYNRSLVGLNALASGDVDEAREAFSVCDAPDDMPNPWLPLGRARLALREANLDVASEQLKEALRQLELNWHEPGAIEVLIEVAHVRRLEGRSAEAVRLLASVRDHPAIGPMWRRRTDEILEGISTDLPGPELTELLAMGGGRALRDVVRTAREA